MIKEAHADGWTIIVFEKGGFAFNIYSAASELLKWEGPTIPSNIYNQLPEALKMFAVGCEIV